VHVNVNVQDPGMVFQQFQNGDHDVVHVTKPGRLELLGVVQASGPVDGDVATVFV